MSPEGRCRVGAHRLEEPEGSRQMQTRVGGTCRVALGRGTRPKGTGGLLAEGGGEQIRALQAQQLLNNLTLSLRAVGLWSRYRWRRKSASSPYLLPR